MPEDLRDLPLRITPPISIARDLCHDLVSAHGVQISSLRNVDVSQYFLIIRQHEAAGFVFSVSTDQRPVCMGENLCDLPLRRAALLLSDKENPHAVPVHRLMHLLRRNKYVPFSPFNRYEAEAARISMKNPLLREILPPAVPPPDRESDPVLRNQPLQHLLKVPPLLLRNTHQRRHILRPHWSINRISYQLCDPLREPFLLKFLHNSPS